MTYYPSTTGSVRKHVKVAESVLGYKLPKGVIVHHVNEDIKNYRNNNLVILQSKSEHNSLHRRMRVKKAGGNPWTQMLCKDCLDPFDFDQFCPSEVARRSGRCRDCNSAWSSKHYYAKRAVC